MRSSPFQGTEVFVENDNCFIRLINNREESYKQQMLLFDVLDVCIFGG